MFGKKKEPQLKLSDEEKDARVVSELGEVQKCVQKSDNRCTVQHLNEAKKYEDCPPCRRVMTSFAKNVDLLPKEKQERKLKLLREYVEPASSLKKTYREMQSIKPSRGEVLKRKARNTVTAVGSGLKRTGSKLANLFKS
jgi:hypothetical protein